MRGVKESLTLACEESLLTRSLARRRSLLRGVSCKESLGGVSCEEEESLAMSLSQGVKESLAMSRLR